MIIRKAVVPIAGLGTRLFPASHACKTEFFPVVGPDGIARALYRDNNPLSPTTPLTPGKVERYDIDLWATSLVFKNGHRIRIEVSSSNFPRYNRNLNTGNPVPEATLAVPAHQRIYHTSRYPSHILLPVIPR